MPCQRCGSVLLFIEGIPSCPDCERIGLVPLRDSLAIMETILAERKNNLMGAIARYDRNHVLQIAFAIREHLAREFTLAYTPLNIAGIVACTAIIKEVLGCRRAFGDERGNAGRVVGMIGEFGAILGTRDYLHYLRAGTYNMIRMARYDPSSLGSLSLRDFPLYPNERHYPVSEAFAAHGILTGNAAAQRVGEMSKDWKSVELGSKKIASVGATISTFYHTSSMLFVALNTNRERQACFALPKGGSSRIPPLKLKKFIAAIPAFGEGPTCCRSPRFERRARAEFGACYGEFVRNFVASHSNPCAFPLFLEAGGEVFTSHFFGELHCYALLPVLHKREFDKETERRSRRFERTVVPRHFEQLGFEYTRNVRVKGVCEIDGIAVSSDRAYVIEAKCWSSKALLGGPYYAQNLGLKVRGAIEGRQRELNTGQIKRRGVPLPDKVDWVRRNRAKYGIKDGAPIEGVLVVNTAPPIREHMGCKVVFVNDFQI